MPCSALLRQADVVQLLDQLATCQKQISHLQQQQRIGPSTTAAGASGPPGPAGPGHAGFAASNRGTSVAGYPAARGPYDGAPPGAGGGSGGMGARVGGGTYSMMAGGPGNFGAGPIYAAAAADAGGGGMHGSVEAVMGSLRAELEQLAEAVAIMAIGKADGGAAEGAGRLGSEVEASGQRRKSGPAAAAGSGPREGGPAGVHRSLSKGLGNVAAAGGSNGNGQGGNRPVGRAAGAAGAEAGATGFDGAEGANASSEGPMERLRRLLDSGLIHQKMDQTALSQLPKLVSKW